jgi:predicted P-loop ATPase
MSQFLLINLDEFNQIPTKIQEGFLKNIIQLARIKIKRPYGKHVEDFPRLASFIATTNERSVLADPTGNRRFIGIELTGAIDVMQPVDYLGLYGQAVTLINRGEQYWFDDTEVREIMAHNRQFQIQSPAEQWFYECFDIATDESDGQWLTCAAIYNRLKRYAGSSFKGNLNHFGRVLNNMVGLSQRRSNIGKCYLVRSK